MSENAFRQISREVGPHERLLWFGKPRGGARIGWDWLIKIAIALFWNLVSWSIFIAAISRGDAAAIFIAVFVLIGAVMVYGIFLDGPVSRATTAYGITDRRVIILHGIRRKQIVSIPLQWLKSIEVKERWDGTGTITIESDVPFLKDPPSKSQTRTRKLFRLIGDVSEVHKLLLSAQARLVATVNGNLPEGAIRAMPLAPTRRRVSRETDSRSTQRLSRTR